MNVDNEIKVYNKQFSNQVRAACNGQIWEKERKSVNNLSTGGDAGGVARRTDKIGSLIGTRMVWN